MESLIVVVSCYKKDFFLTKICVASVKYFHPDAEVYLLKDYLAGYFDSSELESAFDVKVIDLGKKKYGWGAAKVHFILSDYFAGRRVFIIDSDTVFTGRFLQKLFSKTLESDFVVNPDYYSSPFEENVQGYYYKFDKIIEFDKKFTFPGFVFNTGHLIVTPGKIPLAYAQNLFDITEFPYYKRLDLLYMVDQSLLNYWLPALAADKQLVLAAEPFMIWSDGQEAAQLKLEKVKDGNTYYFLIHWAGALRIANIDKMTRPDILHFFQDYYYSKVPMGSLKKQLYMTKTKTEYHLRRLYRLARKTILEK